ncbi:MAG: hypothetical protein ACRYG8_36690 [Janthinobacterium lividum]
MKFPKRMRYVLLAATIAAGTGGVAIAQNAATYDPAQLPATTGKVAQYSLTPRGDVDGLILQDGTEVHFPPHLGTQLVFVAKPGDSVTIHGLKARNVPMVMAMQVTNDATSKSVTDAGPAGGPPPREDRGPGPERGRGPGGPGPVAGGPPGLGQPGMDRGPDGRGPDARGLDRDGTVLTAQGVIKAQLHGPRGDLNGVLLQDGTIVRLPPPEAQSREAALAVGKTIFVSGGGNESALGKVVAARTIGTSEQDATSTMPRRDGRGPQVGGPDAGPAPAADPAAAPTTK